MSVRITSLDNGVRVITEHMPSLETVALGIWVRAGARDEEEAENGIAHLLEHMAFKGTKRRSARAIAEEIEAAGGEINASTGMETTAYFARVLKDDWPLALDILADIFTAPVFDRLELEREKQVILQEIAAANDTPDDLVFDLAQQSAFPDQALGRPVLGAARQVAQYDVAQITAYRGAHYAGSRIVLAAAGNLSHDALVEQAAVKLATVRAGRDIDWPPAVFEGGFCDVERPLDQTHLVMAFPAPGYLDDRIYPLQILCGILGGGMSSRLFQEVREERGLCYSVFSFAQPYRDGGLVSVYAATGPEKAAELTDVMSKVMLSMTDGVSEPEVARMKAQIKAALVMSLESASGRADQIARQYLAYGRVPEMAEILERIDAITCAEISELAADVFQTPTPAVAAVGNLKGLARYEQIAAQFT